MISGNFPVVADIFLAIDRLVSHSFVHHLYRLVPELKVMPLAGFFDGH